MIRPGLQSAFQFIPKVFDGVGVRALCRPVKFFYTYLEKHFCMDFALCTWGIVMLKQERAFPKLLEAHNRLDCHCRVKISLHWN